MEERKEREQNPVIPLGNGAPVRVPDVAPRPEQKEAPLGSFHLQLIHDSKDLNIGTFLSGSTKSLTSVDRPMFGYGVNVSLLNDPSKSTLPSDFKSPEMFGSSTTELRVTTDAFEHRDVTPLVGSTLFSESVGAPIIVPYNNGTDDVKLSKAKIGFSQWEMLEIGMSVSATARDMNVPVAPDPLEPLLIPLYTQRNMRRVRGADNRPSATIVAKETKPCSIYIAFGPHTDDPRPGSTSFPIRHALDHAAAVTGAVDPELRDYVEAERALHFLMLRPDLMATGTSSQSFFDPAVTSDVANSNRNNFTLAVASGLSPIGSYHYFPVAAMSNGIVMHDLRPPKSVAEAVMLIPQLCLVNTVHIGNIVSVVTAAFSLLMSQAVDVVHLFQDDAGMTEDRAHMITRVFVRPNVNTVWGGGALPAGWAVISNDLNLGAQPNLVLGMARYALLLYAIIVKPVNGVGAVTMTNIYDSWLALFAGNDKPTALKDYFAFLKRPKYTEYMAAYTAMPGIVGAPFNGMTTKSAHNGIASAVMGGFIERRQVQISFLTQLERFPERLTGLQDDNAFSATRAADLGAAQAVTWTLDCLVAIQHTLQALMFVPPGYGGQRAYSSAEVDGSILGFYRRMKYRDILLLAYEHAKAHFGESFVAPVVGDPDPSALFTGRSRRPWPAVLTFERVVNFFDSPEIPMTIARRYASIRGPLYTLAQVNDVAANDQAAYTVLRNTPQLIEVGSLTNVRMPPVSLAPLTANPDTGDYVLSRAQPAIRNELMANRPDMVPGAFPDLGDDRDFYLQRRSPFTAAQLEAGTAANGAARVAVTILGSVVFARDPEEAARRFCLDPVVAARAHSAGQDRGGGLGNFSMCAATLGQWITLRRYMRVAAKYALGILIYTVPDLHRGLRYRHLTSCAMNVGLSPSLLGHDGVHGKVVIGFGSNGDALPLAAEAIPYVRRSNEVFSLDRSILPVTARILPRGIPVPMPLSPLRDGTIIFLSSEARAALGADLNVLSPGPASVHVTILPPYPAILARTQTLVPRDIRNRVDPLVYQRAPFREFVGGVVPVAPVNVVYAIGSSGVSDGTEDRRAAVGAINSSTVEEPQIARFVGPETAKYWYFKGTGQNQTIVAAHNTVVAAVVAANALLAPPNVPAPVVGFLRERDFGAMVRSGPGVGPQGAGQGVNPVGAIVETAAARASVSADADLMCVYRPRQARPFVAVTHEYWLSTLLSLGEHMEVGFSKPFPIVISTDLNHAAVNMPGALSTDLSFSPTAVAGTRIAGYVTRGMCDSISSTCSTRPRVLFSSASRQALESPFSAKPDLATVRVNLDSHPSSDPLTPAMGDAAAASVPPLDRPISAVVDVGAPTRPASHVGIQPSLNSTFSTAWQAEELNYHYTNIGVVYDGPHDVQKTAPQISGGNVKRDEKVQMDVVEPDRKDMEEEDLSTTNI